jgi:ATP-binding cassette subfamily B protein
MEYLPPILSIWQLILREKKEILNLYFYAILSGLLQLSVPIGIQAIIGYVMGATMVTSIYVLITAVVLAVLLVGSLTISQMKQVEKIQQNIFTYYAIEFSETLPRLDLKKTDNYYLPEKTNRFFETVGLQKGFSKLLLDFPQASIQIVLGMLLISLYHPVFIAFSLFLLLIIALLFKITGRQGIKTSIIESDHKYALVDWLEEMARSIRTFKFSQGSHFNIRKTDSILLPYLKARTSHFRVLLFQYKTLLAVKVVITAAMLVAGTILLLDQKLNIGEFIAAEIVILTIIAAVEKLIVNLDNVYDVVTGIEKLSGVLEMQKEKSGSVELQPVSSGISMEMNHLQFSYPGQSPCLKNINLHIPAYKKVALTGTEGSGRSTFLRLMSGNFMDFDGQILFNQIPIQNYSLESIRMHTGYFTPHAQDIIKGSLWENIAMGRPQVTGEQIYALADQLQFDALFLQQAEGLNSLVQSEGRNLSSSDIMRVLLLRALVHNPYLILLEEPFHGLSEKEQRGLSQYLLSRKNATVIVSGNDGVYMQPCDQVIHLNQGEIL